MSDEQKTLNPAAVAIAAARPGRRLTRQASVRWGARVVTIGGDAPVRVQSMTNTDTVDVIGTAIQIKELAVAGSELVRITVNTPEAAEAVPHIAPSWTAWASMCPWWATSTTTAIGC